MQPATGGNNHESGISMGWPGGAPLGNRPGRLAAPASLPGLGAGHPCPATLPGVHPPGQQFVLLSWLVSVRLAPMACGPIRDKPQLCMAFGVLSVHCQNYASWWNHTAQVYLCDYHYHVLRRQSGPRDTGFRKLRVRVE